MCVYEFSNAAHAVSLYQFLADDNTMQINLIWWNIKYVYFAYDAPIWNYALHKFDLFTN